MYLQSTLNPNVRHQNPCVFVVGWFGVGIYRFYNCGNSLALVLVSPTIWGGISGMFICFLGRRGTIWCDMLFAHGTTHGRLACLHSICMCVCVCVCVSAHE